MSPQPNRDPTRAGLPMDRWPPQLRLAWQQATTRRPGPFRKDGGGVRRTLATLQKSESGLRRWLGFLHRLDQLNADAPPDHGLTPELLDRYFAHLMACGNSDRSLVGRFEELKLAFELIYPGCNFAWLTRPQGTPLTQLLPMRTWPRFVPSSAELLEWADELYRQGIDKRNARVRCTQIRDALLIGVLAARAPRVRALSLLRLGVHVVRNSDGWLLDQDASITKMRDAILLPLPLELGVMADRYVSTERPRLLRGQTSDAFWISYCGAPLVRTSISGLVWRRTLERFGVGFGPHRFRASLTTTLALESPSASLDASAILGHSPKVSLSSYNRATGLRAGHRHQDRIRDLRQETENLAQQVFKGRF